MGLFSKIFKKHKPAFTINKNQEENLVCFIPTNRSIKLNTKIVVPQNFCALLLSKEKLHDIIPSGEYELNGLTIPKTCKINKLDKPTKKGYKQEFNADFYFVNINEYKLQNAFFIKKLNSEIQFNLIFKIEKPKTFLEFLFEEKISFDNDFAKEELTFYISQLIYYYYLDHKNNSLNSLKEYLIKHLASIGVNLIEIYLNKNYGNNNNIYNDNNDNNNISSTKEPLTEFKMLETDADIEPSSIVNLDDIPTPEIKYVVCNKCGTKLPLNSEKCFNCGESFIEKNTCENCGRVIPVGECVCPYCKSVILK